MKKWLIGGSAAVLAVVTALLCVWLWPRSYKLSPEYYGNSTISPINIADLQGLIDERKSFALLIYQPGCRASEDFEKIVNEFSEKERIKFEKIAFSEVKGSGLIEGLQYYPSVVLYHDGKVETFLKTNEGDDLPAYESLEDFTEWWKKYIKSQ